MVGSTVAGGIDDGSEGKTRELLRRSCLEGDWTRQADLHTAARLGLVPRCLLPAGSSMKLMDELNRCFWE